MGTSLVEPAHLALMPLLKPSQEIELGPLERRRAGYAYKVKAKLPGKRLQRGGERSRFSSHAGKVRP
jgi:hypothetical protein